MIDQKLRDEILQANEHIKQQTAQRLGDEFADSRTCGFILISENRVKKNDKN